MALQGNLHDMTVADLIQHTCQDGKTARITIVRDGEQARLYFGDGQLLDAELAGRHGEEVVYEILSWNDGTFALEPGVPALARTITRSYTGVLLSGAQRLDEIHPDTFKENLSMAPLPVKKTSELLSEALTRIMAESADLESCAVVGTDGMVLASIVTGKLDEARFGAQAAAFYGICIRASSQLARGTPYQAVIQADSGNIVAYAVNANTLFVATTPKDAILGMVFREAADAAKQIAQIF